jgi:hypothetical protein
MVIIFNKIYIFLFVLYINNNNHNNKKDVKLQLKKNILLRSILTCHLDLNCYPIQFIHTLLQESISV